MAVSKIENASDVACRAWKDSMWHVLLVPKARELFRTPVYLCQPTKASQSSAGNDEEVARLISTRGNLLNVVLPTQRFLMFSLRFVLRGGLKPDHRHMQMLPGMAWNQT